MDSTMIDRSSLKDNSYSDVNILELSLEEDQSMRMLGQMIIIDKSEKVYSKEEWIYILERENIRDCPYLELKNSLRNGLPMEIRPRIWMWLSGVKNSRNKYGSEYYSKLKEIPNREWDVQIGKDIHRTYSELKYF